MMSQSKMQKSTESVLSRVGNTTCLKEITDLSVGKSGFPCPPALTQLASQKIQEDFNEIAPMEGLFELRCQISERIKKLYGYSFNPESEINITAGHIQAINTAITSVVKEDDEVIIFEPAFESYVPAISIIGARPKFVSLKLPDFHIDWEELRKMISTKTRMIILNSPHNPTGAVLSKEDMNQLQRITNGTNIIILSDEIFESFVYDNKEHQSIACYENLVKRSFIISSFGPVYGIEGWGLAYCLAPSNLMSKFRKIHQSHVFNVNAPLQHALSDFIEDDTSYLEIFEILQGKRNYFKRLLADTKFKIIPSQGSYFQLIDYSELSNEEDTAFVSRLLEEYNLAVMPFSLFLHEKIKLKMIRVCIARNNETLEKAAEILKSVKPVLQEALSV